MAGLALLAAAAWGIAAHQSRLPSAGPAPSWVHPARAVGAPSASTAPSAGTAPSASRPSEPPAPALPAVLPVGAQSPQIPSLRVSAPASPESAAAGTLGVPDDPHNVGWWMASSGEVVVDGHVDLAGVGPGALYG